MRSGPFVFLLVVIAASLALGALAQRAVKKGRFVRGYFLGNRGLGAWALALTATVQSGGTFMGFPSLVYSHGWVVILWIASYMLVPLTAFSVLGKRLAQVSRRTGAITVPELLRERFQRPVIGLLASIFIVVLLTVFMVAQFKAGAIVMKVCLPGTGALALTEESFGEVDEAYLVGLAVFTVTVVGYTLLGGFLAAVWTDILQSVLMLVGVVILFFLTVPAAGGMEAATRAAMANTSPAYAFAPGHPGSGPPGHAFHPIGLAFSFFVVWVFSGMGQPSGMVRVMACKDSGRIRRSIVLLGLYNALIYIPLVMICIAGRALLPDLEKSDEIIPRLTLLQTAELPGGSLLAGLVLAAPFGAVMSTVGTFLVVIASGLVRDIYQRFLRRDATERELKVASSATIVFVGALAVAGAVYPPDYLQVLIVFAGTGGSSVFLVPAVMACFWRRATASGVLAAMLVGAAVHLSLYVAGWAGWFGPPASVGPLTAFKPYYLLGLDPFVWGLAASLFAGVSVSLATQPPDAAHVSRLFDDRAAGPVGRSAFPTGDR
jgi:SSS family solute:Na+ symporter/sodium/pantothenate symporter